MDHLRDSNESLIGAGCSKIFQRGPIKWLEAKAMLEGLRAFAECVKDRNIMPCLPLIVETDALEVIKLLNEDEEEDLTEISMVIDDIKLVASQGVVSSCSKCSRGAWFLVIFRIFLGSTCTLV